MKSKTIHCIIFLFSLLLTSCKQTVVIYESFLIDEAATKGDLWGFITSTFLNRTFGLWLAFDLLLAITLWQKGHHLLEWFKRRYMSEKIVIIITALTFVFVGGCIPQTTQQYGFWFALPVALAIGSTFVITSTVVKRIYLRSKVQKEDAIIPETFRRQRNLILLAKTMAWIWACGWVIYFVAIGIANQPHVGAEVLLRSAIASLNLFLMNIDSNILDAIQGHDVLKGMIACTGFAAILCTAILIMSLVLSRLMAYLHIRHIRIDNKQNHLYVFFGLNDASKLLADDIYKKDESSIIVFIENSLTGEEEQDEDKTDGWKNIVCMLTHRRKTFIDAHEDERHALAIASCSVCSLELDEKSSQSTVNVWDCVGLNSVKKMLQSLSKVEDAQLHLFFLSEDRDSNVRATSKIVKDATINEVKYPTTIYCHARRDGVNRIIEDMGLEKKIEVRLLDSSYLAVEHLKRDVENHPVSFVDIATMGEENPGTVTSPFTSLVVGFGETGQEAVQFLYEFGAFVDSKSSATFSFRSPFSCHVVDDCIGNLEGQFISSKPNVSCKKSKDNITAYINFYKCDYRSMEFYEKILAPIAKKLNYVVVAIGDDELNMTVAVEILRYVRLHRANLDKFCIYVRAYEKGSFKHLKDIAEYYNDRLDVKTRADRKIRLFGQNQEIYTYELVVKDQYEENGREYYEAYRSLQIDPNNDEGDWEKRRNDTLLSNKGTKWERMSKLRRKESQDRSNALHADTKLKVLEKTLGSEEGIKELTSSILSVTSDGHYRSERIGQQQSIRYTQLTHEENKLMLNMAMLEHLRWNAAHEMMGYKPNESEHNCNELTRQHNCLKPWEELDNESDNAGYPVDFKLFDFGVVETTLKQTYFRNKEG